MLSDITPVLLTFNEAHNIGRTLACLTWAKDIVVVDSESTDDTTSIIAAFPQVRVFQRPFDTHGNQWRYATQETRINTNWILRLDADYEVTQTLKDELSRLDPTADVDGYRVSFDYAIFGQRLNSSLYPSNTLLLRRNKFLVRDKGHTEAWTVQGPVKDLRGRIIHDDRKPTDQWIAAQGRYMTRELIQLREESGLESWLRLHPPLMPLAVFFYCLFIKGLILNGQPGLFYALQRLTAESVLSLMVLEERLRRLAGRPQKGP